MFIFVPGDIGDPTDFISPEGEDGEEGEYGPKGFKGYKVISFLWNIKCIFPLNANVSHLQCEENLWLQKKTFTMGVYISPT